jgi:hypothetical protein
MLVLLRKGVTRPSEQKRPTSEQKRPASEQKRPASEQKRPTSEQTGMLVSLRKGVTRLVVTTNKSKRFHPSVTNSHIQCA